MGHKGEGSLLDKGKGKGYASNYMALHMRDLFRVLGFAMDEGFPFTLSIKCTAIKCQPLRREGELSTCMVLHMCICLYC